MSADFTQFGDAARLYAKYKEVVDRMHKAYQDDIDAFLEALTDRVASLVEPEKLVQKTWSRTYYNWWLEGWPLQDENEPAEGPAVCLYLLSDAPQIASPGTLRVFACVNKKRNDLREAVGSVKSVLPNLGLVMKPKDEEDVFTVIVSYGEDKDSVAFAAKPVAELLSLMNDAIKKVGRSPQKVASS
jgi:hypothetical protein